jgi:hypothetical protein
MHFRSADLYGCFMEDSGIDSRRACPELVERGRLKVTLVQIKLGDKIFALYQGTTSVVPPPGSNSQGFRVCHRKNCTKFH